MEHWGRIGIPMLDIYYEGLVMNPEGSIREMLSFLDLEFSEDCLTPEKSKRIVRTASNQQVRKPINAKSVGRWKNYAEWLG